MKHTKKLPPSGYSASLVFRAVRRAITLAALAALFSGCALFAARELNERYGPEEARSRIVPASLVPAESPNYWKAVKPILDNRCVVCHSCYDAPCQLKLTSPEGVDRGASKEPIYTASRIFASDPTRLYIDAESTSQWRRKGFFPVLNERQQSPQANLESSVLFRMLELKREHPLPQVDILPEEFDFSLDRSNQCLDTAQSPIYTRSHPLWGMPFGFPALTEQEYSTLKRWLELGALVPERPALSPRLQEEIHIWETFLNGDSLQEQLMSRYLYEHLYLGDLYFEALRSKQYFKLVRSKSPPGEKLSLIATRRPTDDPGVSRTYYRLMLSEESPVSKTFMPYALSPKRLQRLRKLFLAPGLTIASLPSYQPEVATNPFRAFKDIPAESRYRFMLDDAEFFVAGFMKGPVCRGQAALSVVDDNFWVFFVDPDKDPLGMDSKFLAESSDYFRLPAEEGSSTLGLAKWHRYAERHKAHLNAKREALRKIAKSKRIAPSLNIVWDGDGSNENAVLTVFRNFDSASVVTGMAAPAPKTAWLMGYPLLERIHYLLSVDFDVFGNYGHQLLTRLYMDFMRVEGENNFLLLLPESAREKEHQFWYRGIGAGTKEYNRSTEDYDWVESGIHYSSNNPKSELLQMLSERVHAAIRNVPASTALDGQLARLAALRGPGISVLPESSLLRVEQAGGGYKVYSLILNRGRANVAVLYLENARLRPEEDTLTVLPGFVGSYPNAFFKVGQSELENFVDAVSGLATEADYKRLLDRFGIRRTNPEFWSYSDWFHEKYLSIDPINGSLLDYNRFENR